MKIKLQQIDRLEFNKLFETKELNITIANMYEDYFSNYSNGVSSSLFNKISKKSLKERFCDNFFETMEIDITDKDNAKLVKDYIYPGVHDLDVTSYKNNAYLKSFPKIVEKKGNLTYDFYGFYTYEGFVSDDLTVLPNSYYREITNIGFFSEPYPYPVIVENGTVWMSLNPNEINTMSLAIDDTKDNVLMLGLGLGYFAYMTSMKSNVKSVTIIENNEDIIELFKNNLLNVFEHKDKIKIIKSDAFDYLSTIKTGEFDFVFSDLWHNSNDGIAAYLRIKKFENKFPRTRFSYWLETGFLCLLRRCLITLIDEEISGSSDENYKNVEVETDEIINSLHFYLKNKEINSYLDIKELISDDSLREIAKHI